MCHAGKSLASIGVSRVQPYALAPGVPTRNRELPSLESTLILNTGAPISIIDPSGHDLHVGTGEAFFAGLHQRFCFSCSGGSQSGVQVRLSPQAAWRILGPVAATCANRVILLSDVSKRGLADSLRRCGTVDLAGAQAAIVSILKGALNEGPDLCLETDWAIGRLVQPGAKIGAIADELSWSRRRLIDRCRQVLGITPKIFARIARYQQVLKTLDDGSPFAGLAIDAGYFDQSHMIRDFSAFTGLSPTAYVEERVTFVQ